MQVSIQELALADLKPSKVNARRMPDAEFHRLIKNIKQDGKMTSTPLVYRDMRIISGHHRVKAALKAGLTHSPCMVITSEVSDDHLTALQLSHNSITGVDDQTTLRQMVEQLPALEQEFASVQLENLAIPKFGSSIVSGVTETKFEVYFLPSEIDEIAHVGERIERMQNKQAVRFAVEPSALLDDFMDAFFAVKQFESKNDPVDQYPKHKWTEAEKKAARQARQSGMIGTAATLVFMARLAKQKIDEMEAGDTDNNEDN